MRTTSTLTLHAGSRRKSRTEGSVTGIPKALKAHHLPPGSLCLLRALGPPLDAGPAPALSSLELVLPGTADLGGEPLGQLLQAAGVLELNLSFPAEELLEVLKQLQPGLGLLLQAFELLHQLRADLCGQRQGAAGVRLWSAPRWDSSG